MTTYLSNRNSDGFTDENGHFRFPLKLVDGEILSGFTPSAGTGLNVVISAGEAKVPYEDYSYAVWSDASNTVTLSTPSTTAPRIDRIVGYVDRTMTVSSSDVNNPGVFKFMAVKGTAASNPQAPTDTQVQSAVQAGNPWIEICRVNVPMNATSITSTYIDTSHRVPVTMSPNVGLPEITLLDGTKVKFAVIGKNDPLPSAIEGTTLIVLKTKS